MKSYAEALRRSRDMPDDVDDLMDELSIHDRNRILSRYRPELYTVSGGRAQPNGKRLSHWESIVWWVAFPLALGWGIAWVLVAMILLITIVLSPLSVVAAMVASLPLGSLFIWRFGRLATETNQDPEEGMQ